MKKIRNKKVLGTVLNFGTSLFNTFMNKANNDAQLRQQDKQLAIQQQMARQQMDLQKQMMNQQNSMAFVNSMNQAYNKDMSGMYNKYQPILRMGGKRVKRKNLSKYKSRF